MRIEQSFSVSRPPQVVFDYLTNPANLAAWQTSKTSVEQLIAGASQLGTRVRERTKGCLGVPACPEACDESADFICDWRGSRSRGGDERLLKSDPDGQDTRQ